MDNLKETETNAFTLRLPVNLDENIQKDAQKEMRSKNSHITFILENYLNSKKETIPVLRESVEQTAQV